MLDLTGDHIALLDDTQLRELVARLCEAELRREGHSTSAVTAGGAQTAADGGLDVVVQLPVGTRKEPGYVPRAAVGYQVKAEDMPRAKIREEMAPGGVVRDSIRELIAAGGAYIIVSSKGTLAHARLKERRLAMTEVVASAEHRPKLEVDFYDRSRVASWVREHPAMVAWVRKEIGQALTGWDPFGAWSGTVSALESPYRMDDQTRLRDATSGSESSLAVMDGIKRIRGLLRQPGRVVRLVGLSGTGKTRLVQALFDESIGEDALDSSTVHYADHANGPDPRPRDLVFQLNAMRSRSIVILDNCPPDIHGGLAAACKDSKHVSVLTVEFDVRDEAVEDTEVFILEPASEEVVAGLIRHRHPNIRAPDAAQIANASGGNARLALAIAKQMPSGESLAGVEHSQLLERIFYQRTAPDEELLRVASVCALVFSFSVETGDGSEIELNALAGLAEVTTTKLYGVVAKLGDRQLVQGRAHWRAVLPQVLAIWLAKRALESIPLPVIEAALVGSDRMRLTRSFSRRLGFLHDSEGAQTLVRKWLSEGGMLGDANGMDDKAFAMLRNVAPVDPELALEVLERSYAVPVQLDSYQFYLRNMWVPLLEQLAYEARLFRRAVELMALIGTSRPSPTRGTNDRLLALFQVIASGTMAPLAVRLDAIRWLFGRNNVAMDEIGLACCGALLRTECRSLAALAFGARPRSYGLWPSSNEQMANWYLETLTFLGPMAVGPGRQKERVRAMIAENLHRLWRVSPAVQEALSGTMQRVSADGFWPEGWIAARNALGRRSPKPMSQEARERLEILELSLRPRDTVDRARTILLTQPWGELDVAFDPDEEPAEDLQKAQSRIDLQATELGKLLPGDPALLEALMEPLVSDNARRAEPFGRGMATSANDLQQTWDLLARAYAGRPADSRRVDVLVGFLNGCAEREPDLAERLLDAALTDTVLRSEFPPLQIYGPTGEAAFVRLVAAAKAGAEPSRFWGAWKVRGSNEEFAELVLAIARQVDGFDAALQILDMRIFVQGQDPDPGGVDPVLARCGRRLLDVLTPTFDMQDTKSHTLGKVAAAAFADSSTAEEARHLCQRLREALQARQVSLYVIGVLLQSIFRVQVNVALDVFFGEPDGADVELTSELDGPSASRLLDEVPVESIVNWVATDPERLVPRVAGVITAFRSGPGEGTYRWSSTILALEHLIEKKAALYEAVERQLIPSSWGGSLAQVLERRLVLPQSLLQHADPDVRTWATKTISWLTERISVERDRDRLEAIPSFE